MKQEDCKDSPLESVVQPQEDERRAIESHVQPAVQRIDARCPEDPHSEEYGFWCECNACPKCEGLGEDYIEDEWNDVTQDYGKTWVCSYCGGTGIDPAACEVFEDYED